MPAGVYYVVLDFEATCDAKRDWMHEIIEFPSVLIDSRGPWLITLRAAIRFGCATCLSRELILLIVLGISLPPAASPSRHKALSRRLLDNLSRVRPNLIS